jgi:hypothetical protein
VTTSLPKGTVDITYNAPQEERAVLGRHAFRDDRPLARRRRRLIMKGAEIEGPELAVNLNEARERSFAVNALVVLICLATVVKITLGKVEQQRRFVRLVRTPTCQSIQLRNEITV